MPASAAPQAPDAGHAAAFDRAWRHGRPTTTIDIDNDSLLLTGEDGLYTSGFRFSRSFRLRRAGGSHAAGWRIGQQLFTPERVTLPAEQLGALDRPYAGWLYAGITYRIDDDDGSELAFGLDLGCLGRCAGGEPTQQLLHRVLHQPKPLGWDSQLSNEFGLVAHVGGRAPHYRLVTHADLRPGIALRIGNIFSDLLADATLRAGRLHADADGEVAYGFLRAGARAVAHDATLQGGLFADNPGRTVRPRRTSAELEAGLHWQQGGWAWRISVVARGNEIAGVPESRGRQSFLRLSISYSP